MYGMTNFGERLKFFRQHVLKMTRKEFCQKYGITAISMQSWENNGVKISKTQLEKLKDKLKETHIDFDLSWIFDGDESPLDILKKDPISNKDTVYKVNNIFFEPLLNKNSIIRIESAEKIEGISCPKFILLKDKDGHMHFGILMMTANKQYIMEAFQGNFYKLTPQESDSIYIIKQITLEE